MEGFNIIYYFIQDTYSRKHPKYMPLLDIEEMEDKSWQRWERDIQGMIEQKEWQATNKYMRLISSNVAINESFYKIRYR